MMFAVSKAEKMPKSTKRFRLTNSGLNNHGYRMLTSGAVLDDFKANPIMLFNHMRPEGSSKDQILPLGYWTDIEVEGDDIYAVPFFDDNDEFAMAIYNKVEAGIIKMCSIGAEALETSDDPTLCLAGQTGETVTKWKLKEVSIVDIGANPDALSVALYDTTKGLIQLSADNINSVIPKLKKMADVKKKVVAPANKKRTLADGDTPPADDTKKDDDVQLDDTTDDTQLADDAPDGETPEETIARQAQIIADLQKQLQTLQQQVQMADDAAQDDKDNQLADKAVALRKITLAQKPHILRQLKLDRKGTTEYLNSIKGVPTAQQALKDGNAADAKKDARLKELSAKSFDELFKTPNALKELQTLSYDTYAEKYEEKFGKKPSKRTV